LSSRCPYPIPTMSPIREDEVAARAMGVNTVNYKLLAFTIGAVLAGTAGCSTRIWRNR